MTRIPSPCVRVCKLAQDGHCIGCGRTLEEIRSWDEAGDKERQFILRRAQRRLDRQP